MQIKKITYSESITTPDKNTRFASNRIAIGAEAEISEKDYIEEAMKELKGFIKAEIDKIKGK